MNSGVGALKVEGPIVQKGSIALEVTMATKQPTSQHHHTETVQWNTYHNPYLPIEEWEEWEQKSAKYRRLWIVMIDKDQQSKAELRYCIQSHVSPCRPSGHPAKARLPGAQPLTC